MFADFTKLDTSVPTDAPPAIGPSTTVVSSGDKPEPRHPDVVRRASAIRKQVAAGDLAVGNLNTADENGGAYYRPSAQTPGLSRIETWQGRFSGSATDLSQVNGIAVESPLSEEDGFDLKQAIAICIAKSIGLAQAVERTPESNPNLSVTPSVSAFSTPNSPMFPPNGRSSSRSPYGNVLDMMNASRHNDSIIGGMLREAVMHVRADEEMSTVSGSIQESNTGLGHDSHTAILHDLETKVEILFYKKGSVLVHAGDTSAGIYYVVDGFLEVRRRPRH